LEVPQSVVDVAHIQVRPLLDDAVGLAPEWLDLVYQRPLFWREIVSIHLNTAILARWSRRGNEARLTGGGPRKTAARRGP